MTERLVDVLDSSGVVLHTYPVTLGELGDAADDAAYEAFLPRVDRPNV
jgi:hypothetical protein